jgi:hypothetical protein
MVKAKPFARTRYFSVQKDSSGKFLHTFSEFNPEEAIFTSIQPELAVDIALQLPPSLF